MARSSVNPRRRGFRVLHLFFSLVISFMLQYLRARLAGRAYNFFEDSVHNRRRAIRIRDTALQMGGVLIKVGQFLSSRVDLLPTEYIEELALLQDEVPGVPFPAIRAVVEESLGGPLNAFFAQFDETPVAAASLGQVHRALLPTGETVAVKVQRPHMAEIVDADLAALRYVVGWLDRHTPIGKRANLPLILREFEETLTLELDYQAEGHHAERLATMFAGNSQIAIPRIYWSRSAGRVLSLQYMRGIKVTDFAAMERAGIDRRDTAEILMRAYLKQVVEMGFFHADPHPGNILVRPGPTIVLLDFGMVGDISPVMRDNLRRVFLGVVRRDFDEILTALTKLGFIPTGADRYVLRQALAWTIETFYEMSFAELQAVEPRLVLDRLQHVFYTQSVQIPAYFAFLGRALGTLSGLCTSLDPSFQFVTVAEPFARRLIAPSPAKVVRQAIREVRTVVASVYALPRLSQAVLDRVEDGSYEVKQPIEDAVQSVRRLERAMSRVLYAVLSSAFLVTAVLTLRTHLGFLALLPLIVAVVLLLNILVSARRSRVRR